MPSADAKSFDPVMRPLNETNFYNFVLDAYNATETDISKQRNIKELMRLLVLIKVKCMMTPLGFQDSCIQFDRANFKGFIVGDPTRQKNVVVSIYLEEKKQFFDLGVIQKTRLHVSDIEEIVSLLQVTPSNKRG